MGRNANYKYNKLTPIADYIFNVNLQTEGLVKAQCH